MLEELNAHEYEIDQELLRILLHVVSKVAEKMSLDMGDVIL